MNTVSESTAIQDCNKICHSIGGSSGEKLKIFYFLPYRPPQWSIQDMVGIGQKLFFFNYVI